MILSFSLENWMSFRDKVTFSMVASKERQHGERVPRLRRHKTRVLPIAAIYGGNASGKSNFFVALAFVRWLVTKGAPMDAQIDVQPFQLDAEAAKHPSRFSLELLVDETIYEFSFAVTRQAVVEERLVQVGYAKDTVLYDRQGDEPNLDASLAKNEALRYAYKGTRDNQLFLTNSVSQKVEAFRPIYDWFNDNLRIIAPNQSISHYGPLVEEGVVRDLTNDMLQQLDTGITGLTEADADIEQLSLPEPMMAELRQDLGEGATAWLHLGGELVRVTKERGQLAAKKLMASHASADGKEVKFEMGMESDGTRRVINLLPAFLGLSATNSKFVVVIDEIDRSLHTLLIHELLDAYLDSCSHESRAQLLLTTHDVQLIDQYLFRRDEMWVTERDDTGATTLFSLCEYEEIRYDKDVRKSYLQGRLGGIPQTWLGRSFPDAAEASGGRD